MKRRKKTYISDKEEKLLENLLKSSFDDIKIRPGFKADLWKRLEGLYEKEEAEAKPSFFSAFNFSFLFSTRLARAMVALCLIFVFGSTTMYAYQSPSVVRGTGLYALKKLVESIEMVTATSEKQKVEKLIKFSNKRLDETEYLAKENIIDLETINDLAKGMEAAFAISITMEDAKTQELILNQVTEAALAQKESLEKIIETVESNSSSVTIKEKEEEKKLLLDSQAEKKDFEDVKDKIEDSMGIKVIQEEPKTPEAETRSSLDLDNEERQSHEEKLDLFVFDLKADDFVKNQEGKIYFSVKNLSSSEQKGIPLQISWGDESSQIENLEFKAEEKKELSFGHQFKEKGNFQIKVTVDFGNKFAEENEENNEVALDIFVNVKCATSCQGGQKRCLENAVQICQEENDCFLWKTIKSCGSNEVCRNGTCISNCQNQCQEGASKCVDNSVQSCGYWSGKCLNWREVKKCQENEKCQDKTCVPICTDQCPKDGASRCAGNKVQTCGYWGGTCLAWRDVKDCGSDMRCENSACIKNFCENECHEGQGACSGSKIKKCTFQNGCFVWGGFTECPLGCQDGACLKKAPNCQKGEKRCQGNSVESCDYWNGAYLDWKAIKTCQDGFVCQAGSCTKDTKCQNECDTVSQKRCQGDQIQNCGYWGGECLSWKNIKQCSSGEKCENGTCLPGTNSCQKVDETRCTNGALEKCGYWGKSYLWWKVTGDC